MLSRRPFAAAVVLACLAALIAGPALSQDTGGQPDDHFMCYKVKGSKVDICADGSPTEGQTCTDDADCGGAEGSCTSNKLTKIDVALQDAFDSGAVNHTAIKRQNLCPPANKNGEGIEDSDTHLIAYRVKPAKGEPKHLRQTDIQVINQFGLLTVDTLKQDRLLVPAAKDLLGPVAEPDSATHNVDHYKCYKAKVSKGTPKFTLGTAIPVTDQFESVNYELSKPTRLCKAVDKNGEGIKNPLADLLCYKAKPASGQPRHTRLTSVYTNDQLGPAIHDTVKQDEFCVPSTTIQGEAGCDPLNAAECLLPYPSTAYMADDGSTDTGVRLNLPPWGMPVVSGPTLPTAPYNDRDGFSPTAQILMHFPQGVDPELSDAARLLAAGCCGQPAGPPWIDTRTYDGRSLDVDSPTLLFDADTGEQIIHFIERDARAEGNAGRQSLVMRPGISLTPNKRYIVAMRNLKTPAGTDVLPEAAFLALRDTIVTTVDEVEARRQYFEDNIFTPLVSFGVTRGELVLAFDFITASDDQLTHQMLTMRDEAYAWLDTVDATPATVPFTVDTVTDFDCLQPNVFTWRKVTGTFESPLFLDGDLTDTTAQKMNVDGNDNPVQNGFTNPNFTISIPCETIDPLGGVSRPIVLGHGLFQTGAIIDALITPIVPLFRPDVNLISGATDWRGLSGLDLAWVSSQVIGIGSSKLHEFEALPDRLSQGMLNTLVLARMMKLGIFNRDTTFEKPLGGGVFPGPTEEMFYYGISLGGIMGSWMTALTPDIVRFAVDVPAINFSCMLQRANPFSAFEALLAPIGLNDPMEVMLGYGLLHELWASSEPAGYITHVTSDRLPGSGTDPVRILMTPAWLDKQVSNVCTEVELRTLGIANLDGSSVVSGLQGIPDTAGPLDSAHVMWDIGSFDLFNPLHDPFIPPLANLIPSGVCDPHPVRPTIPAAIDMLIDFLQPGGVIDNTCNGMCDGGDTTETPLGGTACDPLN